MKTLIRKEVRVLLPTWAIAMLLAIAPAWLMGLFFPPQTAVVDFPAPFFVLPGLLLLAVSSFGQEFNAKTFSLLLSQPVVRNRAWRLKILMLALAFVLVLAAEAISWSLFIQFHPKYSSHLLDALPGMWLWTIALFTGGLWTTLLLRQEIGAFWITLLVPASILAGVGVLGDYLNFSENIEDRIGDVAVLIYSAAGFLFARHMFLRAQDTQWTGGNFFFWRRKAKEQAGSFALGPVRNRFVMLIRKEIQLHDANLFIAAIIFAANLGAVVLLPHVSNVNLKGALEFVWALWLLMPLLIGCAAVADERRLGVAESQLCQPVSRQAAFSIKFFVALVLSLVLGAVIPSAIEWTRNFGITTWWDFWIFVAAPVIFFVSFYASTLSRSTVHAIGMAIAVSVAGCIVFFAFVMALLHGIRAPIENYDYYIGFGRVYLFVGLCLVIFPIVLARLMFWNFRWLHQGWKLFWHNAMVILVSFAAIFILTNLIYFRTWEVLSPMETPRGPARLTAETPVKISVREDKIFAVLPDGRLWKQGVDSHWLDFRSVDFYRFDRIPASDRFIGSNWMDVSSAGLYTLGIQRDGSLWCIPQIGDKVRTVQIGSDTNWLKIAANRTDFLLLKRDGTLWLWGTNRADYGTNEFARISIKIISDLAMSPVRIDPGTNWIDLIPFAFYRVLSQKDDGSFWSWREINVNYQGYRFHLVQETNMDNQWTSYAYNYDFFSAEVKTNGRLWMNFQVDTNWQNRTVSDPDWPGVALYTKKTQLGSDSDWKAVTIEMNSMILLRKDGTLWRWVIPVKDPSEKPVRPVQLGHQSDWVALGPNMGIALAADGSLWSWDDPSGTVWLAPSRRPVYMGNIFEEHP